MKPLLRWLAISFLGMLVLMGALYYYTQQNAGDVPFFYTTR